MERRGGGLGPGVLGLENKDNSERDVGQRGMYWFDIEEHNHQQ